jgi:hypothetical protein
LPRSTTPSISPLSRSNSAFVRLRVVGAVSAHSPVPAAFRAASSGLAFALRESSAFIDMLRVPAAYSRLSMFGPSAQPDTYYGLG